MSFSQTNQWRREYRKHWDAPQCGKVNIWDIMADAELQGIVKAKANGNGSTEPQRFCSCRELVINGKRVACPPGHSCDYVAARTWLIDNACREANKIVGDPTGDSLLGYRWTAEFNRQMDRLAYNAGLLT